MATFLPERHRAAIPGVFLASLLVLGWNAGSPGLATTYVDPVAQIQAQDESLYGSISLGMAKTGDWLTPRFLGRYALFKPPLAYWFEAAWVKALGPKRIALRLPSILAGAATVTLVFTWLLAENAPLAAALTGALLLLSSHLFFALSRIGLTDGPLTFETALAMFALARDPRLASRAGLWMFGIASGAAMMTKGIAGLFAPIALFVFWAISALTSKDRPGWRRIAATLAIGAAVALPWHLYQLVRNTHWFWAEYVLTEVIANSVGSPNQSTHETHLGYYSKRLIDIDAPLFLAAIVALVWKRPRALLAWIAVVFAAAMAFEYRNTSYILPLFPALALLAAGAIPPKLAKWALAMAVGLFAIKVAAPAQTWGIFFHAESEIAVEPVLERYAAMHRGNELIMGDPNDGFSSACLDLPRVRYLLLAPGVQHREVPLDFWYLGLLMTASDFEHLDQVHPQYEQRLRDFGVDHGDPIGVEILAPTLEQIQVLVHDHPGSDFLLPVEWAAKDAGVHEMVPVDDLTPGSGRDLAPGGGRELLLSREVVQRP